MESNIGSLCVYNKDFIGLNNVFMTKKISELNRDISISGVHGIIKYYFVNITSHIKHGKTWHIIRRIGMVNY